MLATGSNSVVLTLSAVLLAACATLSEPPQPTPQQPMPQKPMPRTILGVLKLEISNPGVSVHNNQPNAQAVSVVPVAGSANLDDVEFKKSAIGTYDDLISNRRYVSTTFSITNRRNGGFGNLTLYAVNIPGATVGGTSISSITSVGNTSIKDEGTYRAFQPAHGMGPGLGGLVVNAQVADLQWITPDEAQAVQTQALTKAMLGSDASVLEYGFVARGLNGSRVIAARNTTAGCTANTCKGAVTLAYSFPLGGNAKDNPYRFSLYFVVGDDSSSSASQSREEQSAGSVAGLKSTTGLSEVRTVAGSGPVAGNVRLLCQVKTATSSPANPLSVLFPALTGPGCPNTASTP